MRPTAAPLAAALLTTALAACAAPAPDPGRSPAFGDGLRAVAVRGAPGAPALDYVIDPPDVLAIQVRGEPELSADDVIVAPDGRIARPLVGFVAVRGRTVPQVSDELRSRYARFLRDPDVTVSVVAFRSKYVYVVGAVARPGRYAYTGRESVVDALAQAGFPTRRADVDAITVVSADAVGPVVRAVHLGAVVSGEDMTTNWLLHADDIVHVPETGVSRLGDTLQDLLAPFALPIRVHGASGDARDSQ